MSLGMNFTINCKYNRKIKFLKNRNMIKIWKTQAKENILTEQEGNRKSQQ